MLVAFPVHAGDSRLLFDLLNWINRLGGCQKHTAVLVADAAMEWSDVRVLLETARKSFAKVTLLSTNAPVAGWPRAANEMFLCAARQATTPFLFMEPDCVPLKSGWLDAIADEYEKQGKPFMGCIMENRQPGFPEQNLSGVAVYPANAAAIIEPFIFERAWDIAAAEVVVPQSASTALIQNFWGEPNLPPVFVRVITPSSPANAFTFESLNPGAVLFHRNKDGSLIKLLQSRLHPSAAEEIAVVFPVCGHDFPLAMRHGDWLKKMGRKWHRTAIVVYDRSFPMVQVQDFKRKLADIFNQVQELRVPKPPIEGWPHAPNWMFRHTAEHMQFQGSPWLWLEADAVVLKPDWIERLEAEYKNGLKPFMGPVVQGMGHANGGCIYPVDTPARIPRALDSTDRAWDYEMRPEMIHQCHNAAHLMQHVWTAVNGMPSEVGGGSEPRNITREMMRVWIKPSAVMIHRIKDSSLVNLLLGQ